jgi:hypothetical protein
VTSRYLSRELVRRVPLAAGGTTSEDNLALACVTCSLRKAARQRVRDPRSGNYVPLFHPRKHRWSDHFGWTRSQRVRGKTATGRATIAALGMNRSALVAIRQQLAALKEFPARDAEDSRGCQ